MCFAFLPVVLYINKCLYIKNSYTTENQTSGFTFTRFRSHGYKEYSIVLFKSLKYIYKYNLLPSKVCQHDTATRFIALKTYTLVFPHIKDLHFEGFIQSWKVYKLSRLSVLSRFYSMLSVLSPSFLMGRISAGYFKVQGTMVDAM